MTDEQKQLIKQAQKHGAEIDSGLRSTWITFSYAELRSLLQAVADASYERAADECLSKHVNGNWKYDHRDECADAIRNLKGTLPEMEG